MREWWLRTLLVLSAPSAVFVALRDDSGEEAARARRSRCSRSCSSPGSPSCSRRARRRTSWTRRRPDYDGLLVAVWAFLAGGLFGALGYWLLGAAAPRLGRRRSARRAPSGAAGTCSRSRRCRSCSRSCSGRSKLALYGELPLPRRRRRRRYRRRRSSRSLSLGFLAWSALPARHRRPRRARLDGLGRAPRRGRRAGRDRRGRLPALTRAAGERGLEPLELRVRDRVGVLLLGERAVAHVGRRRRRAPSAISSASSA